jgi:predicted nucleotidyltransferase
MFHPERVVLFGSYARGAATEDSDVDLLVVVNHSKRRNVEQAIAMRLRMDAPFPMDMIVKRPVDVRKRLAMNDTFLRSVMEDGEVMYDGSRQRMG